jgi:hypothetical protein
MDTRGTMKGSMTLGIWEVNCDQQGIKCLHNIHQRTPNVTIAPLRHSRAVKNFSRPEALTIGNPQRVHEIHFHASTKSDEALSEPDIVTQKVGAGNQRRVFTSSQVYEYERENLHNR